MRSSNPHGKTSFHSAGGPPYLSCSRANVTSQCKYFQELSTVKERLQIFERGWKRFCWWSTSIAENPCSWKHFDNIAEPAHSSSIMPLAVVGEIDEDETLCTNLGWASTGGSTVVPFGSVASVLHFNPVARLVWRIGIELNLMWCNYFDDYPCISPTIQRSSAMMTAKSLFGLLGFRFAEDKLSDFADNAEMRGVMVDASQSTIGLVSVDNKDSRKKEVVSALDDILGPAQVFPADLPALTGRLQFADMQLSGRGGKLAMADIRELGHESQEPHRLDVVLIESFCFFFLDHQTPIRHVIHMCSFTCHATTVSTAAKRVVA